MAGLSNARKMTEGNMRRDAYYFERTGGRLMNGSAWSPERQAFKCGSCKRFLSREMLAFDRRNPVLGASLGNRLNPIYCCTFPDCGRPVVGGTEI